MNGHAFTLVELLVVIAIIAILAAILFPVFTHAKKAAMGSEDLSNLNQLITATFLYTNDNDDEFPASGSVWDLPSGVISDRIWQEIPSALYPRTSNGTSPILSLLPYEKSQKALNSPLDIIVNGTPWTPTPPSWIDIHFVSYGLNSFSHSPASPVQQCSESTGCQLDGVFPDADALELPFTSLNAAQLGEASGYWKAKSTTAPANPANTIVYFDQFNGDLQKVNSAEPSINACPGMAVSLDANFGGWYMPNGSAAPSSAFATTPTANGWASLTSPQTGNFAFADGHVKAMPPSATDPDPVNHPELNMWVVEG